MPVKKKVLIIDDEPDEVVEFYKEAVKDDDRYDFPEIIRKPEGVTKEKIVNADIILLDFIFENSNRDGAYVLNLIRDYNRHLKDIRAKIILFSSMKNYSQWDKKLKLQGLFDLGVTDFILKSIAEDFPEIFKFQLDRALDILDNAETISAQQKEIKSHYKIALPEIIGQSNEMNELLESIERVAQIDFNVLVTGETGTGKELVARTIHCKSNRKTGPFVPINCSAITATIIESELFGHEKNAFTGANSRKIGFFEKADGGTIFLDEISEMDPSLQTKLLRAIQEKIFERVGGKTPIDVDVRIIAATNQEIESAIGKGKFREDLYYRLNEFPIYVPPLRDRLDDIPFLAEYFLKKHCKQLEKDIKQISAPAIEKCKRFHWPGNVRELENVIKKAIVMAKLPEISEGDISFNISSSKDKMRDNIMNGYIIPDVELLVSRLIDDRNNADRIFKEKFGIKIFEDLKKACEKDEKHWFEYINLRDKKIDKDSRFVKDQKITIAKKIKEALISREEKHTKIEVARVMGMSYGYLRGIWR